MSQSHFLKWYPWSQWVMVGVCTALSPSAETIPSWASSGLTDQSIGMLCKSKNK